MNAHQVASTAKETLPNEVGKILSSVDVNWPLSPATLELAHGAHEKMAMLAGLEGSWFNNMTLS